MPGIHVALHCWVPRNPQQRYTAYVCAGRGKRISVGDKLWLCKNLLLASAFDTEDAMVPVRSNQCSSYKRDNFKAGLIDLQVLHGGHVQMQHSGIVSKIWTTQMVRRVLL